MSYLKSIKWWTIVYWRFHLIPEKPLLKNWCYSSEKGIEKKIHIQKRWLIYSRPFYVIIMAFLLLSAFPTEAKQPITVQVGLSPFPPYAEISPSGHLSGLAVDLITILNSYQSKYKFVPIGISSMRRFNFFEKGGYDLSMFDHLDWGWDKYPVEATNVYAHGGEKYVTLAKKGRGQSYFDDMNDKKVVGFLGYHYKFADFENDPDILREKFNMTLTSNHSGNLLMVVHQRVDVAIVTELYISRWLLSHPEYSDKFLVSDIWDQEYQFVMLIRKGGPLSVQQLNTLLVCIEKDGLLHALFKKYGRH